MNSFDDRAKKLHAWFCANTGQQIPLTMRWLTYWTDWFSAGHTGPELALVIRYLRRQISIGKRNDGALSLRSLLDLENFEKDLGLAQMSKSGGLRTDRKLQELPETERAAAGSANEIHQAAAQLGTAKREIPLSSPDLADDATRNALRNQRVAELERLKKEL